jgi:hypothetical protein
MALNIFEPEVSTVTKGLKGKTIVIYGANRTGKTLNCSKANKPVFLRFEDGLNAIGGVKNFPINKWSDWTSFVKQATNPATVAKVQEMYETIVIDTIDRMLALGEEYICSLYGIQSVDRDDNGKKAYGGHYKEYRSEVMKWINLLTNSGYTVIFIGHEDTRTLQDDKGEDYVKIYPKGDKKSVDFICDLSEIYYLVAQPNDENGREVPSTLYAKGCAAFLAGSRFTHMPHCIPEWNMAKLEATMIKAIEEEEKESGLEADTHEEAMEKKEAKKKASTPTVPVSDLIEEIGEKLEVMNEKEGNLESYYQILEEELGNRDFKAMNATEKQREQIEQILSALEAKGY